jgi:hypothetical protein
MDECDALIACVSEPLSLALVKVVLYRLQTKASQSTLK